MALLTSPFSLTQEVKTLAKQGVVKTNRYLCFCPFLFTALFPEDLRWSLVFIQVQDDRDILSSDSESWNWKGIALQSNSPLSLCRKREWVKCWRGERDGREGYGLVPCSEG